MGLALGLGAALSWGIADYFAAVASRRLGALRVVLGFHLAALVLLGAIASADGVHALSARQVAFFVVVGAVGWLSYLAFYGALAIGPISVVSPIVSGYAAVTVILAVLVSGEHLSPGQAAAVVVTFAGVVMASSDLRQLAQASLRHRATLGLGLGLVAMAFLGGFVFGVAHYRRELGWLTPILLARAFSTFFLLAHRGAAGLRGRAGRRPPGPSVATGPRRAAVVPGVNRRTLAVIVLLACADTGGYVCFNLGVGRASTSIVATASAPYALVPIAMGVALLHERPNRIQWAGVALVIAGLLMLGLSQ